MRFWDSSAIVPLIVEEPMSGIVRALPPGGRIVWWGTRVECVSAIYRLERQGILTHAQSRQTIAALMSVLERSTEVQPSDALRERAERLLRAHSLTAADALQLAAAVLCSNDVREDVGFVCLDDRLRKAATAQGLVVLPETS